MTSALDRLPPRARQRLRRQEQPEWAARPLSAVTALIGKYHDEHVEAGRDHRAVVAIHPALTAEAPPRRRAPPGQGAVDMGHWLDRVLAE